MTATRWPAVVVPAGGMPGRARELVPAGDVGDDRAAELPDGADDRGRLQRAAIVEGEVPRRAALIERGGHHTAAEAQVRREAVLGDQRVQVGQDLVAGRETPAPPPRPERERIQLRGYVAGQAGVAVIPPGPAEISGPLQHDEVFDACPLERDRHADPAESGADDRHPVTHGHSLALCVPRWPRAGSPMTRHRQHSRAPSAAAIAGWRGAARYRRRAARYRRGTARYRRGALR